MALRRPQMTYNRVNGKTKYDLLLLKLLLADICELAALKDSRYSLSALYDISNKALSKNHIKRFYVMEPYGGRKRKQEYYALTKEGLSWLVTQATNNSDSSEFLLAAAPWLPYVDLDSFSAIANVRRTAAFSYELRFGNTVAFALAVGANLSEFHLTGKTVFIRDEDGIIMTPEGLSELDDLDSELDQEASDLGLFSEGVLPWNDEPDGTTSASEDDSDDAGEATRRSRKLLRDIRADAVARMENSTKHGLPVPHEGIVYIPSREIISSIPKSQAAKSSDYAFRQYFGLLETKDSCIMLYHAKGEGLAWPQLLEKRDATTVTRFNYRCSPFPIDTIRPEAAVLTDTPHNFSNLITDKFGKRKQDTVFCSQYKNIYVFPHSAGGQSLARWIMTTPKDDRRRYIAQQAGTLDMIPLSSKPLNSFFQYEQNTTKLPILDGMEMKLDSVIDAAMFHDINPDVPFGVLCFNWQTDYYRALWPNAQLLVAELPQ